MRKMWYNILNFYRKHLERKVVYLFVFFLKWKHFRTYQFLRMTGIFIFLIVSFWIVLKKVVPSQHPKSTTLHPPCFLTTDSVQWAQTPLSPLQGSQFSACTLLQRTNPPASSLRANPPALLAESGILLMAIGSILIETSSCNLQFFFRTN